MNICIDNIVDLQVEWEQLWKRMNPIMSPYMEYGFQTTYKRLLWIGKQRFGMDYKTYVVRDDDGTIRCIMPVISKSGKAFIAGDLCATGILDFIYDKTTSLDDMKQMLSLLKHKVRRKLYLNKLHCDSVLYKALDQDPECIHVRNQCCACISIQNSFEEYFNSLSKSVRQNIRTAHNRLTREQKRYTVTVNMENSANDDQLIASINELHHKRAAEKNKKGDYWIFDFIENKFNPLSRHLKQSEYACNSTLFIDGKLAAFMQGVKSNDNKTIIIPRLSINSEYGVYCPGSLLISETIKYLIQNTSICRLDLSRGDEKYKYALGAQTYYIGDFVL